MDKEIVVVFRSKKPGSSIEADTYIEIDYKERADVSNLEYLGKRDGIGIDHYIEPDAIDKIDLSDKVFIK